MRIRTHRLATLSLGLGFFVVGCSRDPAPENLGDALRKARATGPVPESVAELQEFGTTLRDRSSGPLRDVDIRKWCAVEKAGRDAKGARDAASAVNTMAEARRKACEALGISVLEHQVINARVTVALYHLDLKIPVPPEKADEVALVEKHRSDIDAARD